MQSRKTGYAELFDRHPIFLYALSDAAVFMKQTNDTDVMFLSGSSNDSFKDLLSATLIKLSNDKQKTHLYLNVATRVNIVFISYSCSDLKIYVGDIYRELFQMQVI